ncbi:Protein of unknown function (DUF1765) [Plasmodiophora brassicae]
MSTLSRSLSSISVSDGDRDSEYFDDGTESCTDSVLSSTSASTQSAATSPNSVRSAIPRRLRPLNLLPFTPWVHQRLKHTLSPSNSPQQLHKLLHVLDSHLRADCFVYSSAAEFRQGKLLLLRVWKRILVKDDGECTMKYASLVLALAQRYEFDLIHMHSAWRRGSPVDGAASGLTIGDPLYMEENSGPSQCLARAYHCLLARTAVCVCQMDTQPALRIVMAALSFFRLPSLCAPLLDACDGSDAPAPEELPSDTGPSDNIQGQSCAVDPTWTPLLMRHCADDIEAFAQKTTDAFKSGLSDQAQFFKFNPSLFNWVNISVASQPSNSDEWIFLDECRQQIGFENESAELVNAFADFRNLLGTDPETLHAFVAGVVAHVTDVAHGSIQWSCVPGLWPLTSAAIRKLQGLRPLSYTSKIRRCMTQYLRNPDVLQFAVRALLRATPLHDKFEVNSCLDHIGSWMAAACSNYSARDSPQHAGNSLSVPLPRSFCHDEFLCALEMLLSSEHFQVLIKTLTLVYSNCGRFVGQHRRQLCHDMLVGIFFNKLFMHWCSEVRRRFHYIVVYKFNRGGLCAPPPVPESQQMPSMSRSRRPSRSSSSNGLAAAGSGTASNAASVTSASNRPGTWLGQGSNFMMSSFSWLSSALGGSVSNMIESGRESLPLSLASLALPSIRRKSTKENPGVVSLTKSVSAIQHEAKRHQRKANNELSEAMSRTDARSEEAGPEPHACVLIRTKMGPNSIADDADLVTAAEAKIAAVDEFIGDPSNPKWLNKFDPTCNVYASASLAQYRMIQVGYVRLQRRRALRFGEVLAPELSFDMVDPVNIDSLMPLQPQPPSPRRPQR